MTKSIAKIATTLYVYKKQKVDVEYDGDGSEFERRVAPRAPRVGAIVHHRDVGPAELLQEDVLLLSHDAAVVGVHGEEVGVHSGVLERRTATTCSSPAESSCRFY